VEKAVRLIDAPVGLLMYKNRLLMKTEYGSYYDGVYSPDCYIVESGEVFIGGTDNAEYRNNLRVTPIDPESLRPKGKWIEQKCEWWLYKCSLCGGGTDFETHYCPHCGALMEE
jgi:hypothetical protein